MEKETEYEKIAVPQGCEDLAEQTDDCDYFKIGNQFIKIKKNIDWGEVFNADRHFNIQRR